MADKAPQLAWVQRGDCSFSNPYRIVRSIRGFELWSFEPNKSGCLGREIATLEQAKAFAERHAAKAKESA